MPLPGLPVGLQAVVEPPGAAGHRPIADTVTLPLQLLGELSGTLAGPSQGGLGIASGDGIDEGFQIPQERGVVLSDRLSAPSRTTDTTG